MQDSENVSRGKNQADFARISQDFYAMTPEKKQVYLMVLNLAISNVVKGKNSPDPFLDWTFDDLVDLRVYLEDSNNALKNVEFKKTPEKTGKRKREPIPVGIKRLAAVMALAAASAIGGGIIGAHQSKEGTGHAMVETALDFDQIIKGTISIRDLKLHPLKTFIFPGVKYDPESYQLRVRGYGMDDIIQYAADHGSLRQLEQALIQLKTHANNSELGLPPHVIAEQNFRKAIDHSLIQIRQKEHGNDM